ncbi:teosinte glume architecture 1 [Sorghum bicolor]|uniref:teosinte glume architecture 1 n=1 Tax=Sorghum bicolor TaxID=4558 RepID=UPI00081AC9F1|nr:teosinte glume architecture 1 [Sorghum bicolor]|eukprot:XP_002457626.2 teosinte glume architecture 1 [Sorghum bicolor]
MDWDLKMSVSWDLPDDAAVPQPPPFTATAAAASPAAASGIAAAAAAATPHAAATRGAPSRAECSVDLKLGGLGRVRGGGRRDEGACGGCNCNGCAIRAVREPDEAPALGPWWRRRGAVPVVRGGRLRLGRLQDARLSRLVPDLGERCWTSTPGWARRGRTACGGTGSSAAATPATSSNGRNKASPGPRDRMIACSAMNVGIAGQCCATVCFAEIRLRAKSTAGP